MNIEPFCRVALAAALTLSIATTCPAQAQALCESELAGYVKAINKLNGIRSDLRETEIKRIEQQYISPNARIEYDIFGLTSSLRANPAGSARVYLQNFHLNKCKLEVKIDKIHPLCRDKLGTEFMTFEVTQTLTNGKDSKVTTSKRKFEFSVVGKKVDIMGILFHDSRHAAECNAKVETAPSVASDAEIAEFRRQIEYWKRKFNNLKKDTVFLGQNNRGLLERMRLLEDSLDWYKGQIARRDNRIAGLLDSIDILTKERDELRNSQCAPGSPTRNDANTQFLEANRTYNQWRNRCGGYWLDEEKKRMCKQIEDDSIHMVWEVYKTYKKCLGCEEAKNFIDIIRFNQGNIIEYYQTSVGGIEDASNKANADILDALSNISLINEYECKAYIKTVFVNIDDYMKPRMHRGDINGDLRRACALYDQKQYDKALETFSNNEDHIYEGNDQGLANEVRYKYGAILLWNLGDVEQTFRHDKGKIGDDVGDRVNKGRSLLRKVANTKATSDKDLKYRKLASITLAKHFQN